ncbi:MAG: isocitrate lyase/PEP mutase family protein [Alphaproteobacteria bacterium]|nr:isocitrate lyase/PEP mutase family protein [Alphaproteobacteria bacterium]
MKTTARMRQMLREKGTVWAAGAYDALSAKFIEEAGFDAVMTSGFGVSASHLGEPDVEIYTMTENLTVVRNATNAVKIPMIADCDTGYGNAINVMRTVREFEAAGVAAVIFEDQEAPKRCPAVATSVEILPVEEGAGKIRAAVRARRDKDLIIVARTDALTEDEAIQRAKAYVAAGADLIQPISRCFKTFAGLKRLREACGVPLSLQILGWLEKDLTPAQIKEVAAFAVFPLVPLMSVAEAMRRNLKQLAQTKTTAGLPQPVMEMSAFKEFIGFPQVETLQTEFLTRRMGPLKAAE